MIIIRPLVLKGHFFSLKNLQVTAYLVVKDRMRFPARKKARMAIAHPLVHTALEVLASPIKEEQGFLEVTESVAFTIVIL